MKNKLLASLSNEEKIKLVMGKNWWETEDLNGKLTAVKVSDGPLGLRCLKDCDSWANSSIYPSVAYPCAQMLAQTWDKNLAYEYGAALADDCIDLNVDIILGPGCNIKRTPLCGRNFEYFSEDPYISGIFAERIICGAQENGVGVALKHYACNNMETARRWRSSEVDERTLRELYLKPFEIACKAKPLTVMSSYNLVNGVRMAENKELFNVLREEFGFDGMIMSDWEVVQDVEKSLEAGLDWEMPYNALHAEQRETLLSEGKINQEALDASAQRVIELSEKIRKNRKVRKVKKTVEERIALSQKIEENGIVLLKNNGVLPLSGGKICLTGCPVKRYYYGGGSSAVVPNRPFVPLNDALRDNGADVEYVETIINYTVFETMDRIFGVAAASDVTIACIGTGCGEEFEAKDRTDISVSKEECELLRYLRKYSKKLVVVVYSGAPLDLSEINETADAVVLAGFGGQNVSQAVANVLCGKVNPSGRLTETWALSLKDIPAVNSRCDEKAIYYEEKLNVGYRYFTTANKKVLYPFGYGLSYTDFCYEKLLLERQENGIKVKVTVKNTGNVDGMETVQVYVRECNPTVDRPLRELKEFDKISIGSGESKTVEFLLSADAFSYYNINEHGYATPHGDFLIEIGKNANEIVLSQKIAV